MNFNVMKYGTAVLASVTIGTAIYYSWDRTRVRTDDIVELLEACAERSLVTTDPTGTISITNVCGHLTNIAARAVFEPSTNLVITATPQLVEVGTNLYRQADGFTNYVWKRYVETNGVTIYTTNAFVSTGQFFRADVPVAIRSGRLMTLQTNVSSGATNIFVIDHQLSGITNIPNAVGMHNDIALLQWIDAQIRILIPKFVNHTYKTNGTYNSWFATQSWASISLPMWNNDTIFDAAGVIGRMATNEYGGVERWFSWPTNDVSWSYLSDYYYPVLPSGPVSASNLWERFAVLSMMQETYSVGAVSNRYAVNVGWKEELDYEGVPGNYYGWTNIDHLSTVLGVLPWAFDTNGFDFNFTDDWGPMGTYWVYNARGIHTNYPVANTNLVSIPLSFSFSKEIVSSWFQASYVYQGSRNLNPATEWQYNMQWLNGIGLYRKAWDVGSTNGHVYRIQNQNALGILGDASFYLRESTNKCSLSKTFSGVDGSSSVIYLLAVTNIPEIDASLIRTNSYSWYDSYSNYFGEGFQMGVDWLGPWTTTAVFNATINTGPVVTKWTFTRCVP